MTALCFDGAYARDLLAQCKAHGAIAMSHYLTGSYASTSPQPHAIRTAGMGVVENWERAANALVGATRAQGQAIAKEAVAALDPDVPRDGTVKIFYSVDVDLTNLAACDDAFRGLNDVSTGAGVQVGVYGEGGLIERLHGLGLVQGGQWLSMSEAFGDFQHALTSGLVAMVQMHYAGGQWLPTPVPNTDVNTILDPQALGAWWPPNSMQGDGMSAADVITALKSPEGQALLRTAVWNAPLSHDGQTTTAAQWLVYGNRFALAASKAIPALASTIQSAQQVAFDTAAAGKAVLDNFVSRITGGTP